MDDIQQTKICVDSLHPMLDDSGWWYFNVVFEREREHDSKIVSFTYGDCKSADKVRNTWIEGIIYMVNSR